VLIAEFWLLIDAAINQQSAINNQHFQG